MTKVVQISICFITWSPINSTLTLGTILYQSAVLPSASFFSLFLFFFAFPYLVLSQIMFLASSLCTIFGCVFHFAPLTSILWSTFMISYMMLNSYMLMASVYAGHLCALGLLISSFQLHFLVSIFPKMLQHVAQAKQKKKTFPLVIDRLDSRIELYLIYALIGNL